MIEALNAKRTETPCNLCNQELQILERCELEPYCCLHCFHCMTGPIVIVTLKLLKPMFSFKCLSHSHHWHLACLIDAMPQDSTYSSSNRDSEK
jgi:hypothetical protein